MKVADFRALILARCRSYVARISYGGGHLLRRTWGLARADEVIE
jgi:hypothetical protein